MEYLSTCKAFDQIFNVVSACLEYLFLCLDYFCYYLCHVYHDKLSFFQQELRAIIL
jgi:hypothetical protein